MDAEENNSGVEAILLSMCNELEAKGDAMFKASGTDSYVERSHIHDAQMLIYGLTNKSRLENLKFNQWIAQIRRKQNK